MKFTYLKVPVYLTFFLATLTFSCKNGPDNPPPPQDPTTATTNTGNWTIDEGWQIPVDVSLDQQSDWYDMSWETFIALMWPAQWNNWPNAANNASAGQPDESKSIVDASNPKNGPYVAAWQTYLSPDQVFLTDGADPVPGTNPPAS